MATADETLPPDPAARRSRALVERRETALSTQVMQDWMSDEDDEDSINLRAYWAVIMRRKWTVLTFFAIVVVAVMTATYLTTPIYRASTLLQIDSEDLKIVQYEQVTSGAQTSWDTILGGLVRLFQERDASLLEINPLIVTSDGDLLALDAKINLDDNGLYRHPELVALRDITQEDPREAAAREHDLNYITLDGNIGCMVNGAGLAMATMDLVQLHGGQPANFLDVGGGTTAARVAEAFKLILSDAKVRAVLVNIFGGIVRCDLIAEGIIAAVNEVGVAVPVVVRLEGTNAAAGLQLLDASGLALQTASDLTEAAEKVVAAAAARSRGDGK